MVAEVRAIAADEMWMSPHYHRASVGFHFTWFAGDNDNAVRTVQQALEPFAPRPHWGKLFSYTPEALEDLYGERLARFRRVARRADPEGKFSNAWLEKMVMGGKGV